MDNSIIRDSFSVENQLSDALKQYFITRLGGSQEDFSNWFRAINNTTEGWKMMSKEKTDKINKEYSIPDWFMWAVHATI